MLDARRMLATLALSVQAAPPQPLPAAPPPPFSVQRFFSGHTRGDGVLGMILSRRRHIVVHGVGHIDPDGALVLDQAIDEDGAPRRRRQWRLREIAAGRYVGTLTDAVGSVAGDTVGARLHLRFHMKYGLAAEQWLSANADGRSVHNVLTLRKLGLIVASLDETITKLD